MCGIAGMINLAVRRTVSEGVVERMERALIHRGPDEEGFLHWTGCERTACFFDSTFLKS